MKSVLPSQEIESAPAPDWEHFVARCQKPDHDRIGSWMARKVSRPAALRITWVVARWGVSAHAATLCAWSVAMAGVVASGWGTTAGWLTAVVLWQTWYLLDHVDGQLARWHGAVSLDGAALDYLMHHAVQLLLPCGVGWGLSTHTGAPGWLLVGGVWGVTRLLAGLQEDTQFKAFEQRWKRLVGTVQLVGGAGGRPLPHDPPRGSWLRLLVWTLRKGCETHVAMNALTALALTATVAENLAWLMLAVYTAAMAVLSTVFFGKDLRRGLREERVERAFSQWFQPCHGEEITYANGWWRTEPREFGQASQSAEIADNGKLPESFSGRPAALHPP